MAENLDALKCGGWGVFIAPTTKRIVGEGFCRMAHRTLSGASATSPGRWVPTVGASDSWVTGQSGGAPDMSCSLSDAPFDACSDSARAVGIVPVHCSRCRRPLALGAIAPLGAPDSPVLHRTVR
jgi:hypothetical protein